MDGDSADLIGLSKLKEEHPFVLLLDEAHATGVYGPCGNGLAGELGLCGIADVTVLTLSKSIGCVGGAVCGSAIFCDALVNVARAYIYSTSLPPMIAAAADVAIGVMETEPGLQQRLRAIASRFRNELRSAGLNIAASDSPIIPIVMQTESAALEAAQTLANQGILSLAIRPPTVARGSSRLRITLSACHSDQDVDRLIRAITPLVKRADGACR
jgi:7-keto-8-aminopelargonate synthetase-like enzyme